MEESMNIEELRQHILSLPGVTEDQPFGDDFISKLPKVVREKYTS